MSEETRMKIRGLRQFKSLDGCAFDFPEEGHQAFEEILFNDKLYGTNYTIEKALELPELIDADQPSSQGGFRANPSNGNVNNNRPFHNTSSSQSSRAGRLDIFVGNLPFNCEVDKLQAFITNQGIDGRDVEIRFVMDKDTGQQKGFGFISTFDQEKYNTLLNLNGKIFSGKTLRVNDANSKPNK